MDCSRGGESDCSRFSAVCLLVFLFFLQNSFLALTCFSDTSAVYRVLCCTMAFLRGFVTSFEVENSALAAWVGLVRAILPNLAGRARTSRSSLQ